MYEVARCHDVPIIGQGGIMDWHDAVEFLLAGASAIGIGTALFRDPLACARINAGLRAYLLRHGTAQTRELTGALR